MALLDDPEAPIRPRRVSAVVEAVEACGHEVLPRRSVGLRTMDLILGLISAATTVVVVVIFSFFIGIVLQAFM
jgi:hypothetical protein